jgi:hypothetical protein
LTPKSDSPIGRFNPFQQFNRCAPFKPQRLTRLKAAILLGRKLKSMGLSLVDPAQGRASTVALSFADRDPKANLSIGMRQLNGLFT